MYEGQRWTVRDMRLDTTRLDKWLLRILKFTYGEEYSRDTSCSHCPSPYRNRKERTGGGQTRAGDRQHTRGGRRNEPLHFRTPPTLPADSLKRRKERETHREEEETGNIETGGKGQGVVRPVRGTDNTHVEEGGRSLSTSGPHRHSLQRLSREERRGCYNQNDRYLHVCAPLSRS